MPQTILRICVTCRRNAEAELAEADRDGARLYRALAAEADDSLRVEEVRCLSGCKRACTAVIAAPDKWAYVLCEIDPDTQGLDLLDYARRHGETPDGQVPWCERPDSLRRKTLARIPPLETSPGAKRDEAA